MSSQPREVSVAAAGQQAPLIIACPICQKPTDSMKRLRVMYLFIFLVLFVQGRGVDYTACPDCTRRFIVKRTLINIVTANLLWPIVLIFNGAQMMKTYSSGHSQSILKEFGRG
jgi:hypothetical protein